MNTKQDFVFLSGPAYFAVVLATAWLLLVVVGHQSVLASSHNTVPTVEQCRSRYPVPPESNSGRLSICIRNAPDYNPGRIGSLGSAGDLGIPDVAANRSTLNRVLNVVFIATGSLAAVYIVVSGLRYVISAGRPEETKKAKDGIIYAVVGLFISIFAYALVNFVISSL